jgi:predicted tellurium resistance membrane protein TerC
MIIGSGIMLLSLCFILLLVVALINRQRLAPWIMSLGLLTLGYIGVSLICQIDFPYQTFNISIYVVFFIAIVLTISGSIGLLVKRIRS